MVLLAWGLAWAGALAWGVLAFARGSFWRADQRLQPCPAPRHWPEVLAVVPARNEAEGIAACVRGILTQEYPGTLGLVVVDDQSSDGTADLARAEAALLGVPERLQVIPGKSLQPGWAGKVWAMSQGVQGAQAPWLWFTDGDIRHGPTLLRHLVAQGEAEGQVLVSLMVRLSTRSAWERWLIPPFIFFFQKLYPFPWVNDPQRRSAAAAGGCMLVRREALERAGGFAAMADALIDDCRLAALLQDQGPLWLGLGDDSESLRVYRHLGEIWRMVARSAYVQLGFSPMRLTWATLGMLFLYALPVGLLVAGLWGGHPGIWVPAALTLILSWVLYWPTLRAYRQPWWMLPTLQPAAWLYTLMTLDSARRHYAGQGGAWKGRSYSRTR